MASAARWIAGIVSIAVLLSPSAAACHPAWVEEAGVVVDETGASPARIAFPLWGCEGIVDVEVTVDPIDGEAWNETLEAELNVTFPSEACLPWDTCQPRFPPTARFSLATPDDDRLNLTGVAVNNLHLTEVVHLTGSYANATASFTIAKPL